MQIPSDQLPVGEGRDKDGNRGVSFFVSREWREEDSKSPGLPIGHETDFERRTWLKT